MIGKTLGHHRVGEQLGLGGMGEVYVAEDLTLNRKVALRFLPEAFTGDPERMARFEREAKLLASLNHPNIAAIYGLEQAEGKRFIVMELVEGETLAQKISKGALPIDEALGICRQIADGLEAAHEKGVIHRDLARSPFHVSLPGSEPIQVFKHEGPSFSLDDWSPDGRHLLYHDSVNSSLLWAFPLSGDQKPMLVTRLLSGMLDQAQFSWDGRWIAFNTSESGQFDVTVIPFPPTGEKWPISTGGGAQPTWRKDGRELYFLAPDSTLMAVDVRPGKTFMWGEAHRLFKAAIGVNYGVEQYAPAPDGNKFLFIKPTEGSQAASVTIVTNWQALLKR